MDRTTVDGGCVVTGIVVGGNVDVYRSTLTEHKSCNHNNSDHIFIYSGFEVSVDFHKMVLEEEEKDR